jgi:predicted enzyme related to lactoylglutathione lyase
VVAAVPRIVHFDISAEKPEQLTTSYMTVFDWKIAKWEGPVEYWLIATGNEDEPGIDGGLSRREDAEPSTVNTIAVPSIDEYVTKVEEHGGVIVDPKHAVPGVGWMASFRDPEGNVFGLMQEDTSAK